MTATRQAPVPLALCIAALIGFSGALAMREEADWESLRPWERPSHAENEITQIPGFVGNRLPSKHYGGYM